MAYKKNAMLAAQRMGNCGYRKLQEATSITSAGAKEGPGGKTAHFWGYLLNMGFHSASIKGLIIQLVTLLQLWLRRISLMSRIRSIKVQHF